MSVYLDRVKMVLGRPCAVLVLCLAALVALQCSLPLATAVKIGVDEDWELSKAVLCLPGHRLHTEIWCD